MKILYDGVMSTGGYPCDVLASALQKFIRRGMTEEAVRVAYELSRTSDELRVYLWNRLAVISVEDIGLGDPMAPVLVYCLNETRKNYIDIPGEFGMFFVHAIRYLCQCKKERGSCNLAQVMQRRIQNGDPIVFPDYVYDKHTTDGVQKGRGHMHFMNESSRVIPDVTGAQARGWWEELYRMTEEEDRRNGYTIRPDTPIEYSDVTSIHGYRMDLCVSALQKHIRRGETEPAVRVAFEMAMTSPHFYEWMWKRLLLISVEDICFGNLQAQIVVHTLNKIRKEFYHDGGIHPMYFTHAIRFLCSCNKERGSCDLEHVMERRIAQGKAPIEFPDYVFDKHTAKGIAMGRGEAHFLREGALVSPPFPVQDGAYVDELLQYAQQIDEESKE